MSGEDRILFVCTAVATNAVDAEVIRRGGRVVADAGEILRLVPFRPTHRLLRQRPVGLVIPQQPRRGLEEGPCMSRPRAGRILLRPLMPTAFNNLGHGCGGGRWRTAALEFRGFR